ncbi:putative hydrolase MutT/NUDIX [Gordonia spumicola]|uniref:Putative hydrolase MutT/NUDIX n=1 Tax=Gordonia spumicola TaxID=589161 RepID=A0A7I9VEJ1_9ACTN|nr:putative hydrolase MutT/NUDIX [Gordonia spumicola]
MWAAGGVLWRHGAVGVEVAIVHRPRYDDWSLPKGKAEPGELLVATAAREIVEETGYEVRMGHRLCTVEYRLHSGAQKKVGYWAVAAVGGDFVPNHECDELRWVGVEQATALVSYSADRRVLHDFASVDIVGLRTLILVRHAKAGRKARYRGDDRQRPLDAEGRRQASALVDVLGLYGVHRLHAADRLRCIQTLEPMADALRTDIVTEPLLSEEAYADDPDAAFGRLLAIASRSGGALPESKGPVHAVCSQGGVIPPVLTRWAERDGVDLPASRNRKGSVWVLTSTGDALISVDHIPSPFAD